MAPLGVKYPVRLFWRYITPSFTFGGIYSTSASGTEQTTETNEHNIVKNLNWLETNQLAFYKCGRGFELRATKLQSR